MKKARLAVCAAAHFCMDFATIAYLYSVIAPQLYGAVPDAAGYSPYVYGTALTAALVLAYDLCAFALQPFFGAWADQKNVAAPVLFASLLIVALVDILAAALDFTNVFAAAIAGLVLVSVANAAFHVAAGAFVIADAERCAPLGIFVGTGALGVALGKVLSSAAAFYVGLGCLVCAVSFFFVKAKGETMRPYYEKLRREKVQTEADVLPLVCLGVAVFLRGFCGTAAAGEFPSTSLTVVFLGAFAACGKIMGGFWADTVGIKAAIASFLPLGALLMCFGAQSVALYAVGTLLFNTSMPVTLFMAIRALPRWRNAAFGMLAALLMAGSVLAMWGAPSGYITLALTFAGGAAVLFAEIKSKNKNLFAEGIL